MEITGLIPHIEALIFASDKPLSVLEITDLLNNAFGFMEDKIPLDQVEAAMEGIVEKYATEFYPFEVAQSGGGWQFLTKKDYHKTVAQLNGDKFMKRLSAAALETLAIVAYKQPVTKGEIEAIRGVSADYAVQKLLEKDLIIITGRNEKLPGHPLVYATSKSFMDYFGINSSDELPKIKEVLAEQLVEPTIVAGAGEEAEELLEGLGNEKQLSVTEDGELVTIEDVEIEDAAPSVEYSQIEDENANPLAERSRSQEENADSLAEQNQSQDEEANSLADRSRNQDEERSQTNNPADVIPDDELLGNEMKQVNEENPGNEMDDDNDTPAEEEDNTNY